MGATIDTTRRLLTKTIRPISSGRYCRRAFVFLLLVLTVHGLAVEADEAASAGGAALLWKEDFENGIDRWEIVDPKSWKVEDHGLGKSLSIIQRASEYEPEVRSPKHIALVKDLEVASFELMFKVKSTKNTGNHRDCCVFFNYQNPTNYYYIHLGAKPDPHSGQIFIVKDAPRTALTENQQRTPWTDDWHTVKLIRDASQGTIAIYFDDMKTPHLEVTDKTFGKGRIGLGSFDDMNAFDEVELREF